MTEKRLSAVGIKRKGEKGFKINSELDAKPEPSPHVGPHLIHDGSGVKRCSVCATPVNVPSGICAVCHNCGAQLGNACG